MKKRNLLLLSGTILIVFCLGKIYAGEINMPIQKSYGDQSENVCQSLPGMMICGEGTVNAVNAYGAAELKGTKVIGSVIVNGKLIANRTDLNNVQCSGEAEITSSIIHNKFESNGSVKFTDTEIVKEATTRGSLIANKSIFSATLTVSSIETFLKQCNTVDIIINKTDRGNEKLYLSNGTIVHGNITFESGNGVVILGEKSIVRGKVIGGKIVST